MTENCLNKLGYIPITPTEENKIIADMISSIIPIIEGRTINQINMAFDSLIGSLKFYQPVGKVQLNRSLPE